MSKLVKLSLGFVMFMLFMALAPCTANGQAPDAGIWVGEYFNNQTLSGPPVMVRNDPAITFDWGVGSPAYNIPVDHFSVRWTRNINTTAGTWRVTMTTDDGVRVWIDNNLVIDRWVLQSRSTWTADISLGAGIHSARVEYFENTLFASAQFSLSPAYGPPGPVVPSVPSVPAIPAIPGQAVWHGQYFNNPDLAGPPVVVRDDPVLFLDWGYGSPDPRIPVDYFSAKWDSTQWLPITGNYTIMVRSDDGVRVWVDGSLVIDQWNDHPPTLYTANRYYTAGAHNVHVEYYERTGTALVTVAGFPGSVVPPQPVSEVIVDDRGPGWQSGGNSANWHSTNGYGGARLLDVQQCLCFAVLQLGALVSAPPATRQL